MEAGLPQAVSDTPGLVLPFSLFSFRARSCSFLRFPVKVISPLTLRELSRLLSSVWEATVVMGRVMVDASLACAATLTASAAFSRASFQGLIPTDTFFCFAIPLVVAVLAAAAAAAEDSTSPLKVNTFCFQSRPTL